MLKNFSLSGSISIVKNCKKGFFFLSVGWLWVALVGLFSIPLVIILSSYGWASALDFSWYICSCIPGHRFFFPRIITSLGGKLLHNNVIFEWLSNLFVFSDLYACSAAMFLVVKYLTFHKMCGCCLVYLWQRQGEIPQRSWLMGKSEGGDAFSHPPLLSTSIGGLISYHQLRAPKFLCLWDFCIVV